MQILMLKLIEFVITALSVVPFEELCGMVTLLQGTDISPRLARLILNTMLKIIRFDLSYQIHFREAKLLEILIGLFKNRFSDILANKETANCYQVSHNDEKDESLNDDKESYLLLEAAADTLIAMIENSADNMSHFRDAGGMILLQDMLMSDDLYREWSLRIFSVIIAQDSFQRQFDVTLLIEILQSSSRSNIQLKIGIFRALKKMLPFNHRAKDAFQENGFKATITILISTQWPSLPNLTGTNTSNTLTSAAEDSDFSQIHQNEEELLELYQQMFQTLTAALYKHYVNKAEFCALVGDSAISDALKVNGILKTSYRFQIYQILLDFATERLIVGTEKANGDEEIEIIDVNGFLLPRCPRIENPFAIGFVLSLLEHVHDTDHYISFIKVLEYMVDHSPVNTQALSEIGIVRRLLCKFQLEPIIMENSLHSHLLQLFEKVATFRMSLGEIRLLFAMLKPKDHPQLMLDVVTRISYQGDSTPFIEFPQNSECRIMGLDNGRMWSQSSGYSFSCWVYRDELRQFNKLHHISQTKSTTEAAAATEFVLLQLESSDLKSFLKLSINEITGHAEVQINAKSKPVSFNGFKFGTDRWYHIVITHQRYRLQTSLATLYVNGRQEDSQRVGFIGAANIMGSTFTGFVGRNNGVTSNSRGKYSSVSNNVSVWRLGPTMLSEDILNGTVISAIYAAGSSYTGCFQGDYLSRITAISDYINSGCLRMMENDDRLLSDSSIADVQNITLSKSVCINADKIVFAFHAREACLMEFESGNSICMRNIATSDECSNGIPLALLDGNAAICSPMSFSDNIQHVDGVIIVLVMIERADTSESLESNLALLAALMSRSRTSRIHNELDRINGYQILGITMRYKAHLITPRILSIIWGMCTSGSVSGRELITNTRICTRWLLDYEIWQKTPIELQCDVFRRFAHILRSSSFRGMNVARLKQVNIVSILLRIIIETPPLEVLYCIVDCIRALFEIHITLDDIAAITDFLLISLSETDEAEFLQNGSNYIDKKITSDQLPISKTGDGSKSSSSALAGLSETKENSSKLETLVRHSKRSSLSRTLMLIAARNLILKNLVEVLNINRESCTSNNAIDLLAKVVDVKWFNQFIVHRSHPITIVLITQLLCTLIDSSALKDERAYALLTHGLVPYCNQPDIYYSLLCVILGKTFSYKNPEKENFTGLCDFAYARKQQMSPFREISIHFPKIMHAILNLQKNNSRDSATVSRPLFDPVSVYGHFKKYLQNEHSFQAKHRWMLLKRTVVSSAALHKIMTSSSRSSPNGTQSHQKSNKFGSTRSFNLSLFDTIMQLAAQIPEFMNECKKIGFIEDIVGVIFVNARRSQINFGTSLSLPKFEDDSVGGNGRDIKTLSRGFKQKSRSSLGKVSDISASLEKQLHQQQQQTLETNFKVRPMESRLLYKTETTFLVTELSSKVLQLINLILIHEFSSSSRTRLLEEILQINSAMASETQNSSFKAHILSNLINTFTMNDASKMGECSQNPVLVHNLAQFSSQIVDLYNVELLPLGSFRVAVDYLVALCLKLEKVESTRKRTLYVNTTFGPSANPLSSQKESPLDVAFASLNRMLLSLLSPLVVKPSTTDKFAEILHLMVQKNWLITALNPINKDKEFWSSMCYLLSVFLLADNSRIREDVLMCWKLMIASQLYPLLSSIMTFKATGTEKTNEMVNIAKGFRELLDKDMNSFMSWFIDETETIVSYFEDNLHPVLQNFKNSESKSAHTVLLNMKGKNRSRGNSAAHAVRRGVEQFYAMQNECKTDTSDIWERESKKHNSRKQQELIRTRIAWSRWKSLRATIFQERAVWANISMREILQQQQHDPSIFVSWRLNITEGPTRMRKRIELALHDSSDPFHDAKYLVSSVEEENDGNIRGKKGSSSTTSLAVPSTLIEDTMSESNDTFIVDTAPEMMSTSANTAKQAACHSRSSSSLSAALNIAFNEDSKYIIDQLKMMEELQMSPGRMRSPRASSRRTREQRDNDTTVDDTNISNSSGNDDTSIIDESFRFENDDSSITDIGDQTIRDVEDPSDLASNVVDDYDDDDEDHDFDDTEHVTRHLQGDDIVREELEEQEMMIGEAAGEDFKIKKLLEPGDSITYRYNALRIEGLDGKRAIFLIGMRNIYIIDNYGIDANNEIVEFSSSNPIKMTDPPADGITVGDRTTSNTLSANVPHSCIRISLSEDLDEVQTRRYLLCTTALELFCKNGRTYFVVFQRTEMRKVLNYLTGRHKFRSSNSVSNRQKMTTLWQRGEISNFEYLMYLNTCAGRSYADLTQYPVFPWILADYSSAVLDLSDPRTFRDLSKPMGAQTETRRRHFEQRFKEWDDKDTGIPKFHYGTHYSSAAIVLYYLMRLEPFTSQNIELQGGRFDLADRLFHSIEETWLSASDENSMSDVKELIPEFFYLPEFLVNKGNIQFGKRQTGDIVGDVLLPPWANGDPFEFIRMNRKALESDYVSEHLHEWIDLVFGFKQTGKEAIASTNVFFYLTYESAVDIDSIEDEMEKQATISQIMNFGQTPHQLFKKAHPRRMVRQRNVINTPSERLKVYANHDDLVFTFERSLATAQPGTQPSLPSLSVMTRSSDDQSTRDMQYRRYQQRFQSAWNWSINSHHTSGQPASQSVGQIHFTAQGSLVALPHKCRLIKPKNLKYYAWGFADNSVRVYRPSSSALSQPLHFSGGHARYVWENLHWNAQITCLDMTDDGRTLVLGGDDSMVSVWRVLKLRSGARRTQIQLRARLCGHSKPITCLAVSNVFRIIVSGCEGGTCIVWDLNNLDLVCELPAGDNREITAVSVNEQTGDIVVSAWNHLLVYTINGQLISSIETGLITAFCLVSVPHNVPMEENMIVTGHGDGSIKFFKFEYSRSPQPSQRDPCLPTWLDTSSSTVTKMISRKGRLNMVLIAEKKSVNVGSITALAVSRDCRKLYAGDCYGNVFSLAVDPSKMKMLISTTTSPSSTQPSPTPTPSLSRTSSASSNSLSLAETTSLHLPNRKRRNALSGTNRLLDNNSSDFIS